MPDIVLLVEKLQEIKLFDTEAFQFYISYKERHRYSCCPLDAIPFGFTGHNGIHFAFLTDFKASIELEALPIICIAPSYDPPINLVAANIHDFFSLLTTIHLTTLLADQFRSQEDFDKERTEGMKGYRSESDFAKEQENQAAFLRKKFGLRIIDNVVTYLKEIRKERDENFETSDVWHSALGVNPIGDEKIEKLDWTKDLKVLTHFLETCNRSSRLQFYRESNFRFILSDRYDGEVRDLLITYLLRDGYLREAENLKMYK